MFNIRYLKSDAQHWSRLAEHIIHEAAHNLLYQLWYQEPIITSDDGVFYTPFRKDERPISGVYHAMFVLARTIYGLTIYCLILILSSNRVILAVTIMKRILSQRSFFKPLR